jgi:hypothetical protein
MMWHGFTSEQKYTIKGKSGPPKKASGRGKKQKTGGKGEGKARGTRSRMAGQTGPSKSPSAEPERQREEKETVGITRRRMIRKGSCSFRLISMLSFPRRPG